MTTLDRYIILTDGATAEQQKKIGAHFRKSKIGWFHRMPQVWLVSVRAPGPEADEMLDTVRTVAGELTTLVIKLKPGEGAFSGEAPEEWHPWLLKAWVDK